MTDILKLTIDSKMGDDWGLVVVTTEKSGLGYPEVEATGTGRRRIRPWSAKMWVFERPPIYRSPVYLRFYLHMNCRIINQFWAKVRPNAGPSEKKNN